VLIIPSSWGSQRAIIYKPSLATAFVEGSLCTLSFLEASDLVDHQHMIIFLDIHICSFQLCEELSDCISGTNLIVSNYKAFVARRE
jgi:hypothetical protein